MFKSTSVQIPCCICGVLITPNPSNMCADCLASRVEFGNDIPKTYTLNYCKTCGRYQASPTAWMKYDLESLELMQMCLKKIAKTKDIKIINANFIWTEPHSKRIKLNVTLEKETFEGTVLRQSIILTFIVTNVQCPNCCELSTPREHWKAIVQLRQHVPQKRTIFWVEQQIISHHAQNSATAIERKPEGLDFQFNDKPSAERFVNFLKSFLPIDVKSSKKLAGQDLQSNTFDVRFTYSVRFPTISRQDLVLLPKNLINRKSGKTRLTLCHKYGKKITLIDPFQGNIIKVDSKTYWTKPFNPLMNYTSLKRFVILGKEDTETPDIAEFEITDEDTYSERILVRSHLGRLLAVGDVCLCYDLREMIFTDDTMKELKKIEYSGVVIVAKTSLSHKKKKRYWKLKELVPHREDDDNEFEEFMNTLEYDIELRNGITMLENGNQKDKNDEDVNDIVGELNIITEEDFNARNVPFNVET